MNLVTSPPPDVRIDFGIQLERAEDDWDVDNPFHSAKLVSLFLPSVPSHSFFDLNVI